MLVFLDGFFLVFHGTLTLFNVLGWIWTRTRRIHLASIGLTFVSWIGLGMIYGLGYCPLTDWHWEVKRRLGHTDLPASYVKYYVDRVTGGDADPFAVDVAVVAIAVTALLCSVALNVRDWRRRNALQPKA